MVLFVQASVWFWRFDSTKFIEWLPKWNSAYITFSFDFICFILEFNNTEGGLSPVLTYCMLHTSVLRETTAILTRTIELKLFWHSVKVAFTGSELSHYWKSSEKIALQLLFYSRLLFFPLRSEKEKKLQSVHHTWDCSELSEAVNMVYNLSSRQGQCNSYWLL